MYKNYLLITFIFVGFGMYGQSKGIDDISFGKGLINYTAKDNSFSVKFAPRMQFRYYGNYDENATEDKIDHTFFIRRARLKFDGYAFSPKLKYKIELGLSNNDLSGINKYTSNTPRMILDAVLKWQFAKDWELWAGQTKLPGNVERVVSSANLQFVDRSQLNSKFNIDRDIGIQLRHKSKLGKTFVTKEKFALSQGEGRNITVGNMGGLQYTGRIELLPMGEFEKKGDYVQADLVREKKPKLMLACTYDYNQDAVKTRSVMGSFMELEDGTLYETDITTIFVDAVYKHNGVSFQGEYAYRFSEDAIAKDANGVATGDIVQDGQALNLQMGYLFKDNIEIVGRYTNLDYEEYVTTADLQQYTIGFSKYIKGHKLKIQTDLSHTRSEGESKGYLFRTGFELHF